MAPDPDIKPHVDDAPLVKTKRETTTTIKKFVGTLGGWYRVSDRTFTQAFGSLNAVSVVLYQLGIGGLALIAVELVATLQPAVGIALYGLLILYVLLVCMMSFFDEFTPELRALNRAVLLGIAVRSLLMVMVAFSELSRYLYLAFGGYQTPYTDYWHWLRYGIARSADDLLFGSVSTFGQQTIVIHETALWSRAMLVLFNASIGLIVLNAIWHQLRVVNAKHAAAVRRQPTSYPDQLFLRQYDLVSVLALITLGPAIVVIVGEQQPPVIAVVAISFVLFFLGFGIWLGAQSIAAIRRFRRLSRWAAVGGFLFGWGMATFAVFLVLWVQASWPTLTAYISRL